MTALPEVDQWVALHSNPGPEHVFVDPRSGQLTGIIDFGDAYFGHPVHDLRRWHCPQDRAAVYAGYTALAPASSNFDRTWLVANVLTDMLAIALEPRCRAAANEELSGLMKRL
jgi:aminoglycoside phosphotransferase (APT) family kinase protein